MVTGFEATALDVTDREQSRMFIGRIRPQPVLRSISECSAMLEPSSTATIDPDFAADVAAQR